MTTSNQTIQGVGPADRNVAAREHNQDGQDKKSSMVGTVGKLASLLCQAVGATALVGLAIANPTISSAVSGAFVKVAAGFTKMASFVSANSLAVAGGAVGAGVLNILDGLRSVSNAGQKSAGLSERESKLQESERGSKAFTKLKSLYASVKRRGALQALVGVAALTVGALALAGVVFNPYGLAAVGVVAVGVLVGVQAHKMIVCRQIKAAQKRYDAINPPPTPAPEPSAQGSSSSSEISDR